MTEKEVIINHIKTDTFCPVEISADVEYTDNFITAKKWRVNLWGVVAEGTTFLDAMSVLQNKLAINEQAIFKLENKVYDNEEKTEDTTETEELNEEVDAANIEDDEEYPIEDV